MNEVRSCCDEKDRTRLKQRDRERVKGIGSLQQWAWRGLPLLEAAKHPLFLTASEQEPERDRDRERERERERIGRVGVLSCLIVIT